MCDHQGLRSHAWRRGCGPGRASDRAPNSAGGEPDQQSLSGCVPDLCRSPPTPPLGRRRLRHRQQRRPAARDQERDVTAGRVTAPGVGGGDEILEFVAGGDLEDLVARLSADSCIACGLCAEKCPTAALAINEKEDLSRYNN